MVPTSDAAAPLRAVDGRVPGRRGLATRRKLIDCTIKLLATTPYRDLKITDITRAAGTSPATLYQYFVDLEDVLLAVADQAIEEALQLVDLIEDRQWTRPFQVFWTPTILIGDRSGKIRYTSVNFLPPEEFLDILDIGEALVAMRWREYDTSIARLGDVDERRPVRVESHDAGHDRPRVCAGRSHRRAEDGVEDVVERLAGRTWNNGASCGHGISSGRSCCP